uniref:Uncharacterized protein n=1 Tax=Panagrolaimus sp. ES5 TaxID=591445 RepID=A0AC34FMP1_9BILA
MQSNAEDSLMNFKSTKSRFYASYRHQNFSLPDSIMHYMAMNPKNAEVYRKLIQSCKYFFAKNPILVISDLRYSTNQWKTRVNGNWKNIRMDDISSKVWITDSFNASTEHEIDKTVVASIISKIYQCNVKNLSLCDEILSYDDIMVIAAGVEHLNFVHVTVKHGDGTVVPVEKLVEQFPRVKSFYYTSPPNDLAITSKTFKELLKIAHFATLDRFVFDGISEAFDIESFYIYMKKNKHTKIRLNFRRTNTAEYKARIKNINNEIFEAENHEYAVPLINYNDLNEEQKEKMLSLHRRI